MSVALEIGVGQRKEFPAAICPRITLPSERTCVCSLRWGSWFDSPGGSDEKEAAKKKKKKRRREREEGRLQLQTSEGGTAVIFAALLQSTCHLTRKRYLQRTDFTAFYTFRGSLAVVRSNGRAVIFGKIAGPRFGPHSCN